MVDASDEDQLPHRKPMNTFSTVQLWLLGEPASTSPPIQGGDAQW